MSLKALPESAEMDLIGLIGFEREDGTAVSFVQVGARVSATGDLELVINKKVVFVDDEHWHEDAGEPVILFR